MNKSLFLTIIVAIWALNYSFSNAQSYEDFLTMSFDYLDQDSLPQAEEALKKALRMEPGNPGNGMVLLNMGTIQRQLGRSKDAEESYTIGLAFMPKNRSLLLSRAKLYAELEKYPEAIEDYTEIIYQEPENEDALYERALCRLMNNDTLGARIDLEQISNFNPNSAKARLGMACVYKAEQMWREAAELYDALIERNPRSASLYRDRAEVFYFSNRFGAAMDDINKSIDINPHDPYSYVLRAQIRYVRGDREYARRDLNQALDLGLKPEEASDLVQKLK